jgi:tRNA G18 (ribose-2'-O)-methylase SpoU
MLERVARRDPTLDGLRVELRAVAARFSWGVVGPVYDRVICAVRDGATAPEAVAVAAAVADAGDGGASEAPHGFDIRVLAEPTDPAVAQYRPKSLRDHKLFHQQRATLAAAGERPAVHGGRRAVTRMLQARALGRPVRPLSFLCTEDLLKAVLVDSSGAAKEADEGGPEEQHPAVVVHTASKEMLEEVRGQKLNTGDSIFALLSFPVSIPLEEIVANPPVLILENVRNAENIGSILRTAYCLGITSVVSSTAGWSALADTRAARCSMGTIYFHRLHYAADLGVALGELRRGGIRIYAAEIGPGAKPVHPHGPDKRWGLVLGNEDTGVTAETLQRCDCMVEIPQSSGDSLNVGHAAAISMFQLGSQVPPPDHDGSGHCE